MMQKKKSLFFILFSCLFLVACGSKSLSIRQEYLSKKLLPSNYIRTPDPLLKKRFLGERLIVNWSLPKTFQTKDNTFLNLEILFSNHTEDDITLRLCKTKGTFVYTLEDEKYKEKEGIAGYKAVIYKNGQAFDTWEHKVWAKPIHFDQN